MRTFFAIHLDESTQLAIGNLIAKLKIYGFDQKIRWTATEKYHVTLVFLGNISEVQMLELVKTITPIVVPPFPLQLNHKVLFFPSKQRASVLALEVLPNPVLTTLVEKLSEAALKLGLSLETRTFKPHLTLGHILKVPAKLPPNWYQTDPLTFWVREVILYQSQLYEKESVYSVLHRISLCGCLQYTVNIENLREKIMPEISRFLGIVISMLYNDHMPPHFHAKYGKYEISVQLEDGIIEGNFPKRALSHVLEWYERYKQELILDWNLAKERKMLNKIPPLE